MIGRKENGSVSGCMCVALFIKFYLNDNLEEYVMDMTRSTHLNYQKHIRHVDRKS